jgi:hypothetical protein
MDPYISNVADVAARELTRRSDIQAQQQRAQAAQAGAFGGSRQAILEAERQRNLQQGIGDIYTQAQSQAYQTALNAAQQQRKQQLASAVGMGQQATIADTLAWFTKINGSASIRLRISNILSRKRLPKDTAWILFKHFTWSTLWFNHNNSRNTSTTAKYFLTDSGRRYWRARCSGKSGFRLE